MPSNFRFGVTHSRRRTKCINDNLSENLRRHANFFFICIHILHTSYIQWWPDEILRQKRFLLCINNHWKYENKQYTIEKPYKIATRNAKKNFEFFKICWFLGPFLKNQCFGKMGVAGIKWGQRSSTIPPFLLNLNEEALLKVSFKNIDWFQICPFSKTTAFSKKALKNNKFKKKIAFLVACL